MRWLAILDTMWGVDTISEAPNFFPISNHNFSGRRLYRLTGEDPGCQWVTNACPELVSGPQHHGRHDPVRLARNLARWMELARKKRERHGPACPDGALRWATGLLVCGKVAQECYRQLSEPPAVRTLWLPHPAARTWTAGALERAAWHIQEGAADLHMTLERGGRLRVRLLQSEIKVNERNYGDATPSATL